MSQSCPSLLWSFGHFFHPTVGGKGNLTPEITKKIKKILSEKIFFYSPGLAVQRFLQSGQKNEIGGGKIYNSNYFKINFQIPGGGTLSVTEVAGHSSSSSSRMVLLLSNKMIKLLGESFTLGIPSIYTHSYLRRNASSCQEGSLQDQRGAHVWFLQNWENKQLDTLSGVSSTDSLDSSGHHPWHSWPPLFKSLENQLFNPRQPGFYHTGTFFAEMPRKSGVLVSRDYLLSHRPPLLGVSGTPDWELLAVGSLSWLVT